MNIDREIAELMGMTPYGQRRGEHMVVFWYANGKEPWVGRSQSAGDYVKFKPEELDPYKQAITEPPKYSTDIGQAMGEVVPKMRERGFVYNLENRIDGTHDCQFHHIESGRWFEMVNHKNPAMAICLAARAAWKEMGDK